MYIIVIVVATYIFFGIQKSTTYIALIQKCYINSTDIFFRETNFINELYIWSKSGNAQSKISARAIRRNKSLGHDEITESISWYTMKCIHMSLDTSFEGR